MRTKNHWLLLLMALMACLVIAACSGSDNTGGDEADPPSNENEEDNGEENGTAGSSFELGSEPLDFSFYGHYDWYTMPPWGEDVASEWIQENKQVTVNAVSSGGNAEQRFSTMIAGDDLPDVIWLERGADVERLRQAGKLVPFDDYLEKYPNLVEWLGEEAINMLRSEDGKLYQFPNWYTSQPNGNAGYVVNKRIYEELDSPPLETPDDLYEYLKLVQDNYPDIVPFETHVDGQGINVLYSAFGEDHSPDHIRLQAVPENGEFKSLLSHEPYIEAMKFVSKLFRERLITQDALTQSMDDVTEKVQGGRVAVYASASPTDQARQGHMNMIKDDPDGGYFMIWPLAKEGLDRDRIYPGSFNQLGWNVSVITTEAEEPEKIFAFLDWLTGPEGQTMLFWGPEGKYWDGYDDEGYPQFTDEYVKDPAGMAELEGVTTNFMWNGNTVFADTAKAKFESTLPMEDRNWTTHWQYEITWATQFDATQFVNITAMPESEEGGIQIRMDDLFEETRALALHAGSDEEVEAIIANAEEDAISQGYEQLLEYKTQLWQENLATMEGE